MVKQADKGFKFEKPHAKVITVPITLSKDNLIVTQTVINGEKHNFIIDSGCPILYLNSKYFRGSEDKGARVSTSEDVNGKVSGGQSLDRQLGGSMWVNRFCLCAVCEIN